MKLSQLNIAVVKVQILMTLLIKIRICMTMRRRKPDSVPKPAPLITYSAVLRHDLGNTSDVDISAIGNSIPSTGETLAVTTAGTGMACLSLYFS